MADIEPTPPKPPSRFLRQYALTQGRVRSVGRDYPLDTLVQASPLAFEPATNLTPENASIAELTRTRPLSIAEIGAHLHVHLGIARVLVSDMVAHELVAVSASDFLDFDGPDLATLERLLDELQTF